MFESENISGEVSVAKLRTLSSNKIPSNFNQIPQRTPRT